MLKMIILSVVAVVVVSHLAATLICTVVPDLDIHKVGAYIAFSMYLVLGLILAKMKVAKS
jgi:multisubunit Na+/H+ antiporter MnhE subunit